MDLFPPIDTPEPMSSSESSPPAPIIEDWLDLLEPEPAHSPDLDLPANSPIVRDIDDWLAVYGHRPSPRTRSPPPPTPPVDVAVSINIRKTKWVLES